MTDATTPSALIDWLLGEVAQVESLLQGSGAGCQLDRRHASPPSLKALEGRYFVLRRALRLLRAGQALHPLQAEVDKARAVLAADTGLARHAAWVAYSKAMLETWQAVQARCPSDGPSSAQQVQ